jgi:hypothetical protein
MDKAQETKSVIILLQPSDTVDLEVEKSRHKFMIQVFAFQI